MATDQQSKGTCFVVMGFGKRTDFETGQSLDLDKSYKNLIKPAVEDAGLTCIRADEIVHSGLIDVPMYEQLLNADVVVADLSTGNKNAFYELGVRHALKPFTTVVICEDGVKTFPFDVNHVAIRKYHHMGEDIGYDEVVRFRKMLADSIKQIIGKKEKDKDSPVYTFINNLTPPAIAAIQAAIEKKEDENVSPQNVVQPEGSTANAQAEANKMTHSLLMQLVDGFVKTGNWTQAKVTMQTALALQETSSNKDPYVAQRLALITYKSKMPTEAAALEEAKGVLAELSPQNSNDTETLGLWGAVHKRLYEITSDKQMLDEAVRAYERGFYLRNDYYNGINFAFLLNARSAASANKAEAIADFVQAQRVRAEVKEICEKLLADQKLPEDQDQLKAYWNTRYWVQATLGEALVGMGMKEEAGIKLDEAYTNAPESWMPDSTKPQISKLQALLEKSPLEYIKE